MAYQIFRFFLGGYTPPSKKTKKTRTNDKLFTNLIKLCTCLWICIIHYRYIITNKVLFAYVHVVFLHMRVLLCFCTCVCCCVSAHARVVVFLHMRVLLCFCTCACCCVSAHARVVVFLHMRVLLCFCTCACCCVSAHACVVVFLHMRVLLCFCTCTCCCVSAHVRVVVFLHMCVLLCFCTCACCCVSAHACECIRSLRACAWMYLGWSDIWYFSLSLSVCVCVCVDEEMLKFCELYDGKAILVEKQYWYYLTHSWGIKGFIPFIYAIGAPHSENKYKRNLNVILQ